VAAVATQTSADWIWPQQEPELSADVGPSLPDVSPLALTQTLRQPFAQTSYICQGYRGFSHNSGYPLDIGVTPQSCNGGNNDSGGKDVVAPASGKVTHMPGTGLAEYLCIQLDGGGAVALGHVKAATGISNGSIVKKGQKVATISHAWDKTSSNAGIAHLHLEAFDGTGCYNGNPKLNGDGKDDIALMRTHGSSGAKLWVWTSTGSAFVLQTSAWSVESGYGLSNVGNRFVAADLDADGSADAITAYQYSDGTFRYHVWKGTGTTMTYGGSTGWYQSGNFPLGNVQGRLVAGNWNGT
jgi:hypothetical protein